jgi:hypothetical protein
MNGERKRMPNENWTSENVATMTGMPVEVVLLLVKNGRGLKQQAEDYIAAKKEKEALADATAKLALADAKIGKLTAQAHAKLKLTVSAKGAISLVGLGRFPATFYREQWDRVLEFVKAPADNPIAEFIAENEAKLSVKGLGIPESEPPASESEPPSPPAAS